MANFKAKGRPELPTGEKLSEIVQFRMAADERAECEKAAAKAKTKLSAWIRERLLRCAKRELKN